MAVTELRAPAGIAPGLCGSADAFVLEPGVESLTIAEVVERTGVTAHTLRYYERIGLLDCPRDTAGRRHYTQVELNRILFVARLRLTDMPIRDIQAYFRLVDAGPGNEHERLALLLRHRDRVVARMADLADALAVVELKIAVYGGTS